MRSEVKNENPPHIGGCPVRNKSVGAVTDKALRIPSETLTALLPPTTGSIVKEVLCSQHSTHHQRTNLPKRVKEYLANGNSNCSPKIERSILSAIFIDLFIHRLSLLTEARGCTIVDLHPAAEGMTYTDRLLSLFQISRRWDYAECARSLEHRATKGMLAELKHFCQSCDYPKNSPLNPAEQRLWSRFNRLLEEDASPAALSAPEAHIAAGIRTATELHWSLLEVVPLLFKEEFSRPPNKLEAAELYCNLPIFLRSLAALSQEILVAVDRQMVIRFPFGGKLHFAGLRPESLRLDRSSRIVSIKPEIINSILRDPPSQDTEIVGCPVLASAGVFQKSCELQLAAATKHLLPLLEPPLAGRVLLQAAQWAGLAARGYSKAFDCFFEALGKRLP